LVVTVVAPALSSPTAPPRRRARETNPTPTNTQQQTATRLLGLDGAAAGGVDASARAMTEHVLTTGRASITISKRNAKDALATRDAWCKGVYGKLFGFLIDNANRSLMTGAAAGDCIIGILDIFGFEVFKLNSFEQLCINFCNEKLQNHFLHHCFEVEQRMHTPCGDGYFLRD
jgi:myosin heavy subunit